MSHLCTFHSPARRIIYNPSAVASNIPFVNTLQTIAFSCDTVFSLATSLLSNSLALCYLPAMVTTASAKAVTS